MIKTAVFPGSFDPVTLGHLDIIKKALPLFDKIIIGIGNNSTKKYLFSLEQRENWIKGVFKHEPKIEVKSYNKLTVELCKENGAGFILRGLRSAIDFEYERPIAHLNHAIGEEIETIFFLSSEKYASISSTVIREIIKYGGDVSQFLPPGIDFKSSNTKD